MLGGLDYGLPQRNWRSHDARRSTSIQPLYFCCHSSWLDVPDRGWNRQLAAGDTQPIRHSLAAVVARLLANDAAGRRASGPDDSICFISSEQRKRHLNRSEVAALLAGALGWDRRGVRHRTKINRHLARFILIALYTGTRHDAILRLRWVPNTDSGWIDLVSGVMGKS